MPRLILPALILPALLLALALPDPATAQRRGERLAIGIVGAIIQEGIRQDRARTRGVVTVPRAGGVAAGSRAGSGEAARVRAARSAGAAAGVAATGAATARRAADREMQTALNHFGFDVGAADGSVGPRTRAGVSELQAFLGDQPTGRITDDQRALLAAAWQRATGGDPLVRQIVASHPEGERGVLLLQRDEMRGEAEPDPVVAEAAPVIVPVPLPPDPLPAAEVAAKGPLPPVAAAPVGTVPGSLGVAPQGGDQALADLRARAEAGAAEAQFNLHVLYLRGQGVEQNEREALRLLRLAAMGGLAPAQHLLGLHYVTGSELVPMNEAEAFRWIQLSAAQGHVAATAVLAAMYLDGFGVAQDYSHAVSLLEIAVAGGSAQAQFDLANMYLYGRGVEVNLRTATDLFLQAAEREHAGAHGVLALIFLGDVGVTRNDQASAFHYYQALRLGESLVLDQLLERPSLAPVTVRSRIQQHLRDDGFYTGPIDGSFGPGTRAALQAVFGSRRPRG